jgi:hypothetical protein
MPGPVCRQLLHRRRRSAGTDAAAVSRMPTEGGRRRDTRLCPATPMAAVAGGEGVGEEAERRASGGALARRGATARGLRGGGFVSKYSYCDINAV